MIFFHLFFLKKTINIFPVLIFIFHFIVTICISDFDFHRKKRLNNGNYLVMTTQGIYLYNEKFNTKIDLIVFNTRIIESNWEMYMSDIEQFSSEDNGYIVCLIKNETYYLSKNGKVLQHITLDYITKNLFYNIIPYGHLYNEYYYVIINIESQKIMIREYIYDSSNNNITFKESYSYDVNGGAKEGITCELMYYLDSKVIACFYGEWEYTFYIVLNTTDFSLISNYSGKISKEGIDGGQLFVSNIFSNKREEAMICSQHTGNFKCFLYNIVNNNFTSAKIVEAEKCDCEVLDMVVEYFPETEEMVFGCKGTSNDLYMGKFTLNYTFIIYGKINITVSNGCSSPNLFHFIYSSNGKYSIVVDNENCLNERVISLDNIPSVKLNDYPTDEIGILICENYYNYEGTGCIDSIEDGYYCNDTYKKTIDKCHDECISCDIGPKDEYTNCRICKNSKYLDYGKCVSSCNNDGNSNIFIDPKDNSNLVCKCQKDKKCGMCSPDSYQYELCIYCNEEEGYYPKNTDEANIGPYINCYNNPDGFYLRNNVYKACYKKCKNCYGHGNKTQHNCSECNEGYVLIRDFENQNNCVKKCNYSYYYDNESHIQCTEEDSCPDEQPKLIIAKKRCIDDCSKDNIYKFEYNNLCYENCPNGTYLLNDNGYLCQDNSNLNCSIYYSYNRSICLTKVPDGYYCNSTEDKTIDKCHENCYTCNEGPKEGNNNCLTCPNEEIGSIYLDLGNCVTQCQKGFYIENEIKKCKCSTNITCQFCSIESKENNLCVSCNTELGYYPKKDDPNNFNTFINCYNNETISEEYYLNLDTQQYESCPLNCKKCNNYNKCIECMSGYSLLKDNNNNENCYSDCSHYYYFDENNTYQCTSDDNCPDGFKLINSTYKCIDDCANEDIYNYKLEYKNICYENCPIYTIISDNNSNLCELKCENYDKYYNYEKSECIQNVPIGFYCNDNISKTINECHENCKTCEEGPTNDNNNCKTCKEENTIYFDLGNCKTNCTNGYFIDEKDSTLKCKCTNYKKCYYCTEESSKLGLCKSCNIEDGYYPKSDDIIRDDGYINCYKDIEGYYLYNESYYPCYFNCKNCTEQGNETDNKCTECKSGYSFRPNSGNNNCYLDCDYYYYFDEENNYKCTNDKNCTEDYSKLIKDQKKCVKNCTKDDEYKYEYNNICYQECPAGTFQSPENVHLCVSLLKCDKYYNYTMTGCINEIPEGFYCNDTDLKTINKCHYNCKTCENGPTNNNNSCSTCKNNESTQYLDLGNCVSSCINDYFIDNNNIKKCKCSTDITCEFCSEESKKENLCVTCNTGYYPKKDDPNNKNSFIKCYNSSTISNGYYLNNDRKQYEPCHSNCLKCFEEGNETENKCTKCKEGFSLITNNNNITNCYSDCPYYYYFDANNIYQCTSGNNCPSGYKLINSTKKCIINCDNDYIYNYKYEYKDICYPSCPNDTISSNTNNNLCELKCENYNKFYNYNKSACIEKIPNGFYCNDTDLKTINQCHPNCETCNEGPTQNNSSCLTCKNEGNLFFDFGNCVSECSNGYFIENSIKKCLCPTNNTCRLCNLESQEHNLCISCNIDLHYYPKKNDSNNFNSFLNCYNSSSIPDGYYLNNISNLYEQCFSSCKNCYGNGNEKENKCTECITGYSFKEDFKNDKNCYFICNNNYYFDDSKNYFCTENSNCPSQYPILIKEKKKCIDDCSKDNSYIYKYENNCYIQCPQNTSISKDNKYICEKTDISVEEISIPKENIYVEQVNNLIEIFYANNHSCEDNNYIDKKSNKKSNIIIYKNINCSQNPEDLPIVDFGECYNKIKEENNIDINEELIIAKVEIKNNNSEKVSSYSFYNPKTGEKLDTSSCRNQTIIVKEDVSKKLEKIEDSKEDRIINLIDQGINVFNSSNDFYKDLCYYYKSPNGKDVPLKARITAFFPNITLCDAGCENVGVDLTEMKAKCECKFIDLVNVDFMGDNLYTKTITDIIDIISELNIGVIKCIKYIFDKNYFFRCTGAFIIFGLFLGKVICYIKFVVEGLYYIRRYFHHLTQSYLDYIRNNKSGNNPFSNYLNNPPRKIQKKSVVEILSDKSNSSSKLNKNSQLYSINSKNNIIDNIGRKSLKLNKTGNKAKSNIFSRKSKIISNKRRTMIVMNKKGLNKLNFNEQNNVNDSKDHINMKEYLSLSFDENDFDDVIDKDKRSFCAYFFNNFKENQIFINTFYIKEPLRPFSLKCLFLILTIELYFTITALFYNEDYLTDLFYSEEEEKFFSFLKRRFNQSLYSSAVVEIISYLIMFFFIEERKIKKIFIRNKQSELKMKYEITIITKDIERRFIGLIILSALLTVICFIYISCFNIAYPYIKKEWIKSSLFVLILMQIINLLVTFIQSLLRYMSIKCNSEKLFKLSQIFAL